MCYFLAPGQVPSGMGMGNMGGMNMGGMQGMQGMQGMGFGLQNAAAMGARLGLPGMSPQAGSSVILVSNLDEQVRTSNSPFHFISSTDPLFHFSLIKRTLCNFFFSVLKSFLVQTVAS